MPVDDYTRHIIIQMMVDFGAFKNRVLKYSILASFFQSLGYLSVVFLIIMYLQGVRGLSPLNASILLIPGYVVGSLLSPFMGRLSDRYGARAIASIGIAVTGVAILFYLMLRQDSPLYLVMVASASIPRSMAFEIFIGTTNLSGGISREFIAGMDSALWASLILLAIAGSLSIGRGEEKRG